MQDYKKAIVLSYGKTLHNRHKHVYINLHAIYYISNYIKQKPGNMPGYI